MKQNRWLFWIILSLVLAILALGFYIILLQINAPSASISFEETDARAGIQEINPPRSMPNFSLINQNEESVEWESLAEKPILLTFGFTHCPDVCPLTLNDFKQIAEKLGTASQDISFVFISVDGKRDTPASLKDYLEVQKVPFVLALTGNTEEVQQIGADYGLKVILEEADEQGNYGVSHSAGIYLLDEGNKWLRKYPFGSSTSLIAQDIEALLSD